MSSAAGDLEARYRASFAQLPIVAILRGLRPEESVAIGEALVEAGINLLEVPLNSPDPFTSIGLLAKALDGRALVGAGTVYTMDEVEKVAASGGKLIVSPNTNPDVIKCSREQGLISLPGFFTPTEAAAALAAGAHALKLFPGEGASKAYVKALQAILPKGTQMLLVGGVSVDNIADWRDHVDGFGIGSAIYKPGITPAEIGGKARALIAAYRGTR
ncbi:2-dehydro-3-deoxy-6-phosphogalactonate aldolase [Methylovirgula sp. 4M-Z18]|uniref:2-dehydro-3-deoxy-6-phosphogalactonate aldolase n=1 Tax=Methylovirgula sp. 4M-Z18 TaxID=2293567 RepID=UPI000E2ED47B|nr:2-dehydro-3-deoxy-6-phosphogalactonate aldolase [Methylovirgula sp. 4M-Z18]RFB81338.1 2-dehydro-3-deoxy-6-phosphogalactonate aldolase [Methylovirgula sp. 4M-Z18]